MSGRRASFIGDSTPTAIGRKDWFLYDNAFSAAKSLLVRACSNLRLLDSLFSARLCAKLGESDGVGVTADSVSRRERQVSRPALHPGRLWRHKNDSSRVGSPRPVSSARTYRSVCWASRALCLKRVDRAPWRALPRNHAITRGRSRIAIPLL